MRTITLAVANRPEFLAQLFDSLRGIEYRPSKDDFKMIIRAEPMGTPEAQSVQDLCRQFASEFDIEVDFRVNDSVMGIVENTRNLMVEAFEVNGSTSNLYLEDDFVLSPDVFYLWDWYLEQDLADVALLCLFNRWGSGDPETVHRSRAMMGWGFILTSKQWYKYAKPAWRNPGKMWDTSMAEYIRTFPNVYNLFPDLSRSTNTGKVGVHVNPETWDRIVGNHKWNKEAKEFEYRLTDEVKP